MDGRHQDGQRKGISYFFIRGHVSSGSQWESPNLLNVCLLEQTVM